MSLHKLILVLAILPLAAFTYNGSEWDDARVCAQMQTYADEFNPKGPIQVDEMTIHKNVTISCKGKGVQFNKIVSAKFSDMGAHWQQNKQGEWSEVYCKPDSLYRNMVATGWKISSFYAFADGKKYKITAKCN